MNPTVLAFQAVKVADDVICVYNVILTLRKVGGILSVLLFVN